MAQACIYMAKAVIADIYDILLCFGNGLLIFSYYTVMNGIQTERQS